MKYVFLTSEAFIRSNANINDETHGKYIQSALREAQEMGLQTIVGTRLLRKLQELVSGNTINNSGNEKYKELVDRAQFYLLYATVAKLIPVVGVHISNFGLSTPTDENMQALNRLPDIFQMSEYYVHKADFFARELQLWLLENRNYFPELSANKISQLRSNLYSAASCGVWLGGARGKGYGFTWRDFYNESTPDEPEVEHLQK